MDKEVFDQCVQIERRMHHLCYATYKCGMDGDAYFTPVDHELGKLYEMLGFDRIELNDIGYELAKKDNIRPISNGTVTMTIPDDMVYSDVCKIINAVTEVTLYEGGRESSLTGAGDLIFYYITEKESDELYERLAEAFGEKFVDESLNYAYESNEEELGTVCGGCWKDMTDEEVFMIDGTAYCKDCYERIGADDEISDEESETMIEEIDMDKLREYCRKQNKEDVE